MPDLLLELFSEEIPARMQIPAQRELERLIADGLAEGGIRAREMRGLSGPRRIALIAHDVPERSTARIEERRGPRQGAPEKAVAGFLRSAGLSSLEQCAIVDDAKGAYYLARIETPGRPAAAIIRDTVTRAVRQFSWPKSMRWGAGGLTWVRPLHSILCLFGGEPLLFEIDGLKSGAITYGHRFLQGGDATGPQPITIRSHSTYAAQLRNAKVVSERGERAQIILDGAKRAAATSGLVLVEDHGLLEENAGLVEWPVVLSGRFDPEFLDVPEEILTTAMRAHQKCFSLRDRTGKLARHFIVVANLDAADGGRAIVAGNERVIRARLADARFFWENDRARPLAEMAELLGQVTFHEKLGTQLERVERIRHVARGLAPLVGADPSEADEAAALCKADLMSETVGEFPELQGVIGGHIARAQGHGAAIADAIAEHYKPQGPSDTVPSSPVSIAVALADKLDMIVGFWAIGEKPTGSKDPYALRRAVLGVIRIIIENKLSIDSRELFGRTYYAWRAKLGHDAQIAAAGDLEEGIDPLQARHGSKVAGSLKLDLQGARWLIHGKDLPEEFFLERLKVHLRDAGARHDILDAAMAIPETRMLMIARRAEALGHFLETETGASLLGLIRRTLNILRIEEKKDGRVREGNPMVKLFRDKEEKALGAAIKVAAKAASPALEADDFETAMAALAKLRAPVDMFFDKVTVNTEEPELRENRLELLAQIRALTLRIADFSKIEG